MPVSARVRLALVGALAAAALGGLGLAGWRKYTGNPWSDGVVTPVDAFALQGAVPGAGPAFALAMWQTVGVRMEPGHQVRWVNNGAVFTALIEAVRSARSSVHIDMYIWEQGTASSRLVEALLERIKAGVACRIVVDDLGSPNFREKAGAPLVAAGCEVRVFRPLPDGAKLGRNHRKLVIIDGRDAFTGGFGVRDNWLGDGIQDDKWRDASARFSGPAVAQAQQAFAENWQEAGGTLLTDEAFPLPTPSDGPRAAVVTSSASPYVTRAERLTQLLIAAARHRLWISNAYFVPSQAIRGLLAAKAAAGVDVRVLTAGKKSDSKTSFGLQQGIYGALRQHGVRFFEYQPSMLHSKTMVVDDNLSLIGSINLDPLSLNTLEDVALVVDDRTLTAEMAQQFSADCLHATEQTLTP